MCRKACRSCIKLIEIRVFSSKFRFSLLRLLCDALTPHDSNNYILYYILIFNNLIIFFNYIIF